MHTFSLILVSSDVLLHLTDYKCIKTRQKEHLRCSINLDMRLKSYIQRRIGKTVSALDELNLIEWVGTAHKKTIFKRLSGC